MKNDPPKSEALWNGPLFIVGYSRSGTTLLRTILNKHSRVNVVDETHYFEDLRVKLGSGKDSLSEIDRAKVRRYFNGIKMARYAFAFEGESTVCQGIEEPESSLEDCSTADQVFQAYCVQLTQEAGKDIWGEKTPRHLFRVREMHSTFPGAKFVIVMRDPRGVIASYRDWKSRWLDSKNGHEELAASVRLENRRARLSYNISIITFLWVSAAKEAAKLQAEFGSESIRMLRFEDLLRKPEENVRSLMGWIGQAYEPQMLDVDVVSSSYDDYSAVPGINPAIAKRWKRVLSKDEVEYVSWLAGGTARAVGYTTETSSPRIGVIIREAAVLPFAVARALRANAKRIGSPFDFVMRRLAAMFSSTSK